MSEINPQLAAIAREQALFLYSSALARGDESTIDGILQMAAQDAVLEEMIFELHDLEAAQELALADDASATKIRELIAAHLPSAIMAHLEDELEELPPVTIAEVVARIQSDSTQHQHRKILLTEAAELARRVSDIKMPLPDKLNQRALTELFHNLGITVSNNFQNCFRETALFLNMGRQQSQAQLAATRRQRKASIASKKAMDSKTNTPVGGQPKTESDAS